MTHKIPDWMKGHSPTAEQLERLRKIKPPVTYLGKLPNEEVPEYLGFLRGIASYILGMALYDDLEGDLKCAERIISMVEKLLVLAKEEVETALAELS